MEFETYQERLKFARERLSLSQKTVAGAVGIKQATYSDLESGKSEGSKFTLEIAYCLRVNGLWLATGRGKWTDVTCYDDDLKSFERIDDQGSFVELDTYRDRLKFARKRLGYSQVEVSEGVGIRQPTYSQLESGKAEGSKYTPEIADYLRVNGLWLATGKGSWSDITAHPFGSDATESVDLQLLKTFNAISAYGAKDKHRILRVLKAYLDE